MFRVICIINLAWEQFAKKVQGTDMRLDAFARKIWLLEIKTIYQAGIPNGRLAIDFPVPESPERYL